MNDDSLKKKKERKRLVQQGVQFKRCRSCQVRSVPGGKWSAVRAVHACRDILQAPRAAPDVNSPRGVPGQTVRCPYRRLPGRRLSIRHGNHAAPGADTWGLATGWFCPAGRGLSGPRRAEAGPPAAPRPALGKRQKVAYAARSISLCVTGATHMPTMCQPVKMFCADGSSGVRLSRVCLGRVWPAGRLSALAR